MKTVETVTLSMCSRHVADPECSCWIFARPSGVLYSDSIFTKDVCTLLVICAKRNVHVVPLAVKMLVNLFFCGVSVWLSVAFRPQKP